MPVRARGNRPLEWAMAAPPRLSCHTHVFYPMATSLPPAACLIFATRPVYLPRDIFARTADYPSPPRVRGGRAQHNPGYLRLWVAGVPVAVVASWVSAAAAYL